MTTPESDPAQPRRRSPRKKSDHLSEAIERGIANRGVRIESDETPEELRARLANEKARLALELWRDRAVIRLSIVAFSILGVACLVLVFLPGQPRELQTWGCSILSSKASGVICYSLGKSGKGP